MAEEPSEAGRSRSSLSKGIKEIKIYMIRDEGIRRDWLCDNFMEWI